jgi:D-alanine-D-alanine ligase
MRKKRIAFLTGGYSGEAVISYKSAVQIESNLDTDTYDVYKIDITPQGWFHPTPAGEKIPIDRNDFSLTIDGQKINFDAVLIGIHGTPGEDGKLQGYLDLMGLPYTSCDAATSALTFNKRYTVAVAAFAGIRVSQSVHLIKGQPIVVGDILSRLQLPVFVKPNNGGSSIGMSRVNEAADLEAALEKAFAEDDQVLVEEYISGREFTIGVFRSKGEVITLPMTEILTEKEFFDYEAKYQGKSSEVTPAVVDEAIAAKIRDAATRIYNCFNCRGVIRIDFIYNEAAGAPFMLEINTVPGQTEMSVVPQQVRAMGWTLKDFYSSLIEECLQ